MLAFGRQCLFWSDNVERVTHWFLGVLIAASVLFFWGKQAPFAAGADASGYMNFARLLSEGRLSQPPLIMGFSDADISDRRLYEPLGYAFRTDGADLVPIYPSGMPLLIAAFGLILDPGSAVSAVMLVAFASCGLLTYLLGVRLGLPPPCALLATIGMMGSQLTIFMGMIPMTDVLSASLLTLCCLLATCVHRGARWGFILGFVLALAVLVRPTNSLVFLAVPAFIGRAAGWKSWMALLAGGTPGLIWLLYLNTTLYGSPLVTGYGSILPLLKSDYLVTNLKHFAIWLTVLFTPLLAWPILASPFLGRDFRRKSLPLILWAAPFFVFFSFYSFSSRDWWFVRFLLPAMPAFLIGSALVWHEITERWYAGRAKRWGPWALVVTVAFSHIATGTWKGAADIGKGHVIYQETGSWINEHTNAGDGLLCMQFSGSLDYYTENRPILRFDFLNERSWKAIVSTAGRKQIGIYAVLYFVETDSGEALKVRAPGDWHETARYRHATVFKLNLDAPWQSTDSP